MMENPYVNLYDPLPAAQPYLDRIGYEGDVNNDVDTLNRLIRCHAEHVPFENIDVFLKQQTPSLVVADLWDKIVLRRRGGYCFELNGLFVKLLEALGFEVYGVGVRIQMGLPFLRPITHRAMIVILEDRKYYVDVGFGGPAPITCIDLSDNDWQQSGSRSYRVEWDDNMVYIYMEENGEESLLFQFLDDPWDEIDYLAPNLLCSVPGAHFAGLLCISMRTPGGHRSMDMDSVKLTEGGQTKEIALHTDAEREAAMAEYFGIHL